MILRSLLALLLCALHLVSLAQDAPSRLARVGRVAIALPAGLDGPDRSTHGPSSELYVYFSQKAAPPVLFQLTRIILPADPPPLPDKARYEAASHFLAGFLRTFGKNVQDWQVSPTERLRLGGEAAVKASWSGNFHGIPTEGVMFLFVAGKEGYCLHAFGQSGIRNDTLRSSVRAIEALRLAPAGAPAEGVPKGP